MTSQLLVMFLEVDSANAKKECLITLTTRYFFAGWRLLFVVENEAAQSYLEQLLWAFPPELLLPHVISQQPCRDRIVITCRSDANLNQADVIFNLRPDSLQAPTPGKMLLELWDTSAPPRLELASQRYSLYQQQGHDLERQPWQTFCSKSLA
jgi:DNA polymerase IIIc chi subunit